MRPLDPTHRATLGLLAGAAIAALCVLLLALCAERTEQVRLLREFPEVSR